MKKLYFGISRKTAKNCEKRSYSDVIGKIGISYGQERSNGSCEEFKKSVEWTQGQR